MSNLFEYANKKCPQCKQDIKDGDKIVVELITTALELTSFDVNEYDITNPEQKIGSDWDYSGVSIRHLECPRR